MSRWPSFGIVVLLRSACASLPSTEDPASADAPELILHSGKILTVNEGFEIEERSR